MMFFVVWKTKYFIFYYSARAGWIPTFGDLTYNLAVQYGWVYGLSLTEMEIVHGAFRKCNPNGEHSISRKLAVLCLQYCPFCQFHELKTM